MLLVLQVYEAKRFGADILLGEASLPIASVPRAGRPKYHWLPLLTPQQASGDAGADPAAAARDPGAAGKLHVRVQWAAPGQQRGYDAVDIAVAGIGVSLIDSMSTQVLHELAFVHINDLQVLL